MKSYGRQLLSIYLPDVHTIPLEQGIVWEPTWKSTPISDKFISRYRILDDIRIKCISSPNIFVNLKHEMASFIMNVCKIHSLPDGVFSPGILWEKWIKYPFYPNNTMFANRNLEWFERCVGPIMSSLIPAYQGIPLATGRLAQVLSGAGKRRIFAICNYVKQRLLYPVHKWAMIVLSKIPMDGTFNQIAPIDRLRVSRFKNTYSFDLKSATDRWPLSVIYTLVELLFGPTMASSIVNGTLGLNTFIVDKPIVCKMSEVAFLAGQPLGYYGSWSLFSLSHHFLVWLASAMIDPAYLSKPFKDYAILGDDVVIA